MVGKKLITAEGCGHSIRNKYGEIFEELVLTVYCMCGLANTWFAKCLLSMTLMWLATGQQKGKVASEIATAMLRECSLAN